MSQASRVVTVGIIGCGRAAETRHLPALRGVAGIRVLAAADTDKARAARLGERFRIERRYGDAAALLADRDVEAVAVCVPARLHAEVVLAALDAGKHVLVEKPLAVSLDDAERISRRAEAFPGKVMVGFNMRWHRLVRQARAIVARGGVGPIELVRTAFTSFHETLPAWQTERAQGGGALFDIAVHHIDLWRYLLEAEVDEISAVSRSGRWEDETVTVMARLANGIPVTSVFSERTGETNELEIFGQEGRLRVSCYHFDGLEVLAPRSRSPGGVGTRVRQAARSLLAVPSAVGSMRRGGDFFASYGAEWRHFADAIRHDTPVECTVDDGRRALEVLPRRGGLGGGRDAGQDRRGAPGRGAGPGARAGRRRGGRVGPVTSAGRGAAMAVIIGADRYETIRRTMQPRPGADGAGSPRADDRRRHRRPGWAWTGGGRRIRGRPRDRGADHHPPRAGPGGGRAGGARADRRLRRESRVSRRPAGRRR